MNEKETILMLEKSQIFTPILQKQLIKYFDKISINKQTWIIQALKTEKQMKLNYLKSLKNSESISFTKIKSNIEKITKQKRNLNELQEKKEDTINILNLLNSLEY